MGRSRCKGLSKQMNNEVGAEDVMAAANSAVSARGCDCMVDMVFAFFSTYVGEVAAMSV